MYNVKKKKTCVHSNCNEHHLKKKKFNEDNINYESRKQNNNNIIINDNGCGIESIGPSPTPPPAKYFHKPKHKANDGNNSKAKHRNKSDEINKNNNRDRLLEMGFNKIQIINRPSNQSPQFVFNQLIKTFTHDVNNNSNNSNNNGFKSYRYAEIHCNSHLNNHNNKLSNEKPMQMRKNKQKKKSTLNQKTKNKKHPTFEIKSNTKYTQFKDSYYISVNCHICKMHFNNIDKYKQHIQNHNNDFRCQIGSKKIPFTDIFSHTNVKPFKCNIITNGNKCNASARTKGDLKTHWQTHFKAQKYNKNNKNNKNKKHKTLKTMRTDADTDFESGYYVSVQCHLCTNKHFNKYNQYRDHMKWHYDNNPKKTWLKCDMGCEKDTKLYSSTAAFMYHIAYHTDNRPFKCNVIVNGNKCEKEAGSKCNLKRHWYSHQNKRKYTKASESDYESQSESDYESSTFDSSSDFSSYSSSCQIESESESETGEMVNEFSVVKHGKTKTQTPKKNGTVNNKIVTNKSAQIQTNIIRMYCNSTKVRNPNIYKCEICVKTFKYQSNLISHRRIHRVDCPKCSFCGKKFARQSNLIQHIRTHTNERPYVCSYCPKAFKQKHSLTDHIRTHTGERPFTCNICFKSFAVKHNLVVHKRIHSGEKPYACTICNTNYSCKSGINSHLKHRHPNIWKNRKLKKKSNKSH